MANRKQLPGKFVWFECVTSEIEKAKATLFVKGGTLNEDA